MFSKLAQLNAKSDPEIRRVNEPLDQARNVLGTSLLRQRVNYEAKKFYNVGQGQREELTNFSDTNKYIKKQFQLEPSLSAKIQIFESQFCWRKFLLGSKN